MTRFVKPWEPSFSYHATVSSVTDAESGSTSPPPADVDRDRRSGRCPPSP
ncbi:hypothetical protein SO694_0007406 [Aureococcus anophagefferens]|uniref:Fibronectin type-III domain-containing protein n=1 Tax=Aureococcus anophagefferens TaxID=44056 RepID=A0ABR1FHJ8_AURAN